MSNLPGRGLARDEGAIDDSPEHKISPIARNSHKHIACSSFRDSGGLMQVMNESRHEPPRAPNRIGENSLIFLPFDTYNAEDDKHHDGLLSLDTSTEKCLSPNVTDEMKEALNPSFLKHRSFCV